MDKKGITWVGNVYKRFEDMCLDVEEDTIKYVENQFQSVGESVRRFYSNVMHDFLPPLTSMESEKNPKDDNENLTEQGSVKKENESITRTVEDKIVTSPLTHVRRDIDNSCRPSGGKIARSGLRSRKSRGQGNNNGNNLDSSVNENRYLDENLSESMAETRESSRGQTAESTIESSNEMVTNGESIRNNENENGFRSSNDSELCLNVPVSSIEGSSQDEQIQGEKCADEEIFMSHPNQPTMFFDRNLAIKTEPVEESLEKHRSMLEETIVVVNQDDLHSLPQIECKQTTNKKKIRGSLYSVMRSVRKHEYRQLAYNRGDSENMDKKSDDSKKLRSHDFCESEWEIL